MVAMRRSPTRLSVRRALVAASMLTLLASSAYAAPPSRAVADRPSAEPTVAEQTLDVALDALTGSGYDRSAKGEAPVDASLALRDLWAIQGQLAGSERAMARRLLARPTDGPGDPLGFGYTVPAEQRCAKKVCIHWVSSTADAPPSTGWVRKALKTFNRVYKIETKRLDFRKPLKDGASGGNQKFDVYLKELGINGIQGYCAPETRVQRFLATTYCVLDNNFTEWAGSPAKTQLVTAAHEFFHAVQNAYDAEEDRWVVESTATWMEERVADGLDRNRAYLAQSTVAQPNVPLDAYVQGATYQYGNWAFFEFLSSRYGKDVVRRLWAKRLAADRTPDNYSMKGVVNLMRPHGGLPKVFAAYSAANTVPGRSYKEGRRWPAAPVTPYVLSTSVRATGTIPITLDHLTSASAVVRPDGSLNKRRQRLRIRVTGLGKRQGGAAYLLIDRKKGGVDKRFVRLNGRGKARVKVPFSRKVVKSVTLTVVNASTRYRCYQEQTWSCQGIPRHDRVPFSYSASLGK